jgi:hypothetical protein
MAGLVKNRAEAAKQEGWLGIVLLRNMYVR